jgi:hypothetical protein
MLSARSLIFPAAIGQLIYITSKTFITIENDVCSVIAERACMPVLFPERALRNFQEAWTTDEEVDLTRHTHLSCVNNVTKHYNIRGDVGQLKGNSCQQLPNAP